MAKMALTAGVLASVVVLGAAMGRADTIPLVSTDLDVTASINRTINWSGSGYDQWNVAISSLNGPARHWAINIIQGTWSVTGSGAFNMVSSSAISGWWGNYTTNALASAGFPQTVVGNGQSPAPLSFVNFNADIGGYSGWGRTGSGQAFSSFDGCWDTATATSDISDGVATAVTSMAKLYVPTGTALDLNYTGALSFTYGGGTVEMGSLQAAAPGDANADGRVDINDLTIVLTNYGKSGMTWSQGDFNNDDMADINDLTIVLTDYGKSLGSSGAGVAPVPEPASMAMVGIGAVGLLGYGWRKRRI